MMNILYCLEETIIMPENFGGFVPEESQKPRLDREAKRIEEYKRGEKFDSTKENPRYRPNDNTDPPNKPKRP